MLLRDSLVGVLKDTKPLGMRFRHRHRGDSGLCGTDAIQPCAGNRRRGTGVSPAGQTPGLDSDPQPARPPEGIGHHGGGTASLGVVAFPVGSVSNIVQCLDVSQMTEGLSMKAIRFEKIHDGKDVFVDDDAIDYHALLRIVADPLNPDLEKTTLNLALVETILKEGTILDCDDVLKKMEFFENYYYSQFLILLCSFDQSFQSSFLVFWKMEQKAEIERIGKTRFVVKPKEQRHLFSPHFHVIDPDGEFSVDFNGCLTVESNHPSPKISKRIRSFLSTPDNLKFLKAEWNR